MNETNSGSARLRPGTLLVAGAAVLLVAFYFWSRHAGAPVDAAVDATPAPALTVPAAGATSAASLGNGLPPGAHMEEGILLDAQGNRILNEAGLPPGPPLEVAKPIPIAAAPSEIVGYRKDANGVSQPMRAGDIKTAANTPGTYAVVDMWANGGPTVVAPSQGRHLTETEVAKLRAAEEKRDAASASRP